VSNATEKADVIAIERDTLKPLKEESAGKSPKPLASRNIKVGKGSSS